MTRAGLLGLSLSGAALILTLVIEIRGWLDEGDPLAQLALAPTPTQADRARGEQLTPAALLATILARPVFSPSRQPADEQPPAPPAPPPPPAPPFRLPRLAGVMVGAFGRSAIFAGASQADKPVVAGIGARLGPYEVVAIGAGAVTLRGPQGDEVLSPGFDGAPQPGPGPGAPQGGPALRRAPAAPPPVQFFTGPGRQRQTP